MRAVGLKTLKNKLSEYIRLAARGETVLVTDRDRVVAEIVPPQSGRADLWATHCWPTPCGTGGCGRRCCGGRCPAPRAGGKAGRSPA